MVLTQKPLEKQCSRWLELVTAEAAAHHRAVVQGETGVSVYMCSSLQFLPQVITINDSVLLVNQPG